ncbi:hypothetical protein DD594_27085 [Enterobacter cloacae complex sp. 4DZ1-17B1]|nr:hypothetical protein DD594_27085 [Enterobacter cloacae complex sp. 4DZ1-17B1]
MHFFALFPIMEMELHDTAQGGSLAHPLFLSLALYPSLLAYIFDYVFYRALHASVCSSAIKVQSIVLGDPWIILTKASMCNKIWS